MTGKAAPIELKLIESIPGKLFYDVFTGNNMKAHYFLHGYTEDEDDARFTPVHFTGKSLEAVSWEEFEKDRMERNLIDERFQYGYKAPSTTVTFSEKCPPAFAGKTMVLPAGCYPFEFTNDGLLLLRNKQRVCFVDESLKVIAKLPIKGSAADLLDGYLLTASESSFCVYGYAASARICIYQIIRKN
ncbi:MAG: hypothetical protein IJ313_04580 [Clostridia bacterium]|nr:hypothetical protein [Clostridia bacterium]